MEENRLCLGTGRESVFVFTHLPLLPFVTASPIAHGHCTHILGDLPPSSVVSEEHVYTEAQWYA